MPAKTINLGWTRRSSRTACSAADPSTSRVAGPTAATPLDRARAGPADRGCCPNPASRGGALRPSSDAYLQPRHPLVHEPARLARADRDSPGGLWRDVQGRARRDPAGVHRFADAAHAAAGQLWAKNPRRHMPGLPRQCVTGQLFPCDENGLPRGAALIHSR